MLRLRRSDRRALARRRRRCAGSAPRCESRPPRRPIGRSRGPDRSPPGRGCGSGRRARRR
ncbi:MAG: hypothetical protein DRI90_23705 [Deltaproteobacteria bacterium]|nr:MAG: hypothetical protein DRI90_23705 [Deltaproteobacteria bacterium]